MKRPFHFYLKITQKKMNKNCMVRYMQPLKINIYTYENSKITEAMIASN